MNNLSWGVADSLYQQWSAASSFLPALLGAFVVMVVGILVAVGLEIAATRVLQAIRFDQALSYLGLEEYFKRAKMELKGSWFVGRVVFWFMILVFTLAASDSLGLYAFSAFLQQVLAFIPSLAAGVLILLAAFAFAKLAKRLVSASVAASRLHASKFLGSLTYWSIVIFGLMAALEQLGISLMIVQALVYGIIAAVSLATGLAFGLGGRESARDMLDELRERMRE
jgi:hypothetical protein